MACSARLRWAALLLWLRAALGFLDASRIACFSKLRATLGLLRFVLLCHLCKVLVGPSIGAFFTQDECEEHPA